MENYEVVVIGGGPAGYVAAIRCAQLGMQVACIDERTGMDDKPALGGTCLNVGCIPSKALLDSSHHFQFLQKESAEHGISCDNVQMDVAKLQKRKQTVVSQLTQGIGALFKKNKISSFHGSARLEANKQVVVTPADGATAITLQAQHIIIASGSVPIQIPVAPQDGEYIVDSTGALSFDQVPERLALIGAGVIGLELGSVWSRLGAKVTVLEALPNFLAAADADIAKAAARALKRQGLKIQLNAKVTNAEVKDGAVQVTYDDAKKGTQQLEVDRLVVAVGRKPNTESLNAEGVGLNLDNRGAIEVDEFCQTNLPDVYAIGDVVRGPMLAHKGSEEGVMVAERLAGQKTEMEMDHMPWVIYTWPEIAWVGKTEQELKAEGIPYKVGSFPMSAIGRARAMGDTTGMVKVISHAETDRLLGMHIFAANASELLAEGVLSMAFEGSSEDLARTIHAHPTLSEALHEAALAVDGRAVHS